MRSVSRTVAFIGPCLSLLACGGGGGEAPPTPVITSGNYVSVAQEGLAASFYLLNSSNFANGTPTLAAVAPPNALAPVHFALRQLAPIAQGLATQGQPPLAASASQTVACPDGGSMSVSANDANGNATLDAGDSITLSMSQCKFQGSTLDGTLEMDFSSVSGNPNTSVYAFAATMKYTNLAVISASNATRGNGSLNLSITSRALHDQTLRLTAPHFSATATYGGASHALSLSDFVVEETMAPSGTGFTSSTTSNGTFSSSALEDKPLSIATSLPFVRASTQTYPASGQASITDATGRKLRVSVSNATSVLIEGDADGNGSYELSTSKLWSELL